MQIRKSQPEGKQIMPETRFPALSVDPRFLGLHRSPMVDFFSYLLLVVFITVLPIISLNVL